MRQRATVEALSGKIALVSVRRESACSGDCHQCAGCGAVTQTLQVQAENPIGARKGDKVYLESDTAVVLWAVMLVYLLPVLCFFVGYFLGYSLWHNGWLGLGGFLLGWIPALCYNRYIKHRPPRYVIVGFVER